MKTTRLSLKRVLSFVMALAMIVSLLPAVALAATPTTLYLTPNSNWTQASARFAAYFFGNGEKWVSMTDSDGDGIYEVEVPSGYPNVIFCRMNPSTTANNWNNKWNQTGDLTVPTNGNNHFIIPNGSWNGATSGWTTYTPSAPVEATYIIAGSGMFGTEWDTGNTANQMTLNAQTGLYEKTDRKSVV